VDGTRACETPDEAADGADFVLTMLADGEAVEETVRELDFGDAVWLQMSTVGIDATERLMELAGEAPFVDAPVVGTKAPAEQGTLVVLAAGPPEARDVADQVFDVVGSRTVWVDGDATAASALKLVVSSWVLALLEGVAEAVSLAEGAGLDPQLFLDTIKGGPTDTPYAHAKGAMMLAREFPPSFALSAALKDAGLVLDLAAEVGVDLTVADAVRRHLARAVERGHGDEDMAATYYAHSQED
jgi:3-hydroxyisobutyrate dehydrogenase